MRDNDARMRARMNKKWKGGRYSGCGDIARGFLLVYLVREYSVTQRHRHYHQKNQMLAKIDYIPHYLLRRQNKAQ